MEPFPVHVRASAGGYDFALAGRCTAIVYSALPMVKFRVLMARAEQELARAPQGFRLLQSAFLLPNLKGFSDPIDLARASIGFLQRHPEYEAHYTLTRSSLIGIATDVFLRAYPRFDARLVSDRNEIGFLLRKREKNLPVTWYDLPVPVPAKTA
jgi:hypothetical protein